MYEAVSETFKDPTAEPRLEPVKKGPFDNDNELPSKSVKLSLIVRPVKALFPVFWTVIVYFTISPLPVTPSPLSVIVDVLVTSIEGEAARETSV